MNLIGLVRVTDDVEDVARQHAALDPICVRVFEEPASRKRLIKSRPDLQAAVDELSPGDVLVVTRLRHLAQGYADALEVLGGLFDLGVVVKVLEGTAAGEHAELTIYVDLGRDIARLRGELVSMHIRAGMKAARERGVGGGRRSVVDADTRAAILSHREQGESLRSIAQAVGVSVGTVHNVLADPRRPPRTP
ncbi:recombinase family protein [Propionibacteriaceae bacterium G1746]